MLNISECSKITGYLLPNISILAIKTACMIKCRIIIFILTAVWFFYGCSTMRYIQDPVSQKRQTELKKMRSGNIFTHAGKVFFSLLVSSVIETNTNLIPNNHEFQGFKLINPDDDTLYINMLTDVYWDEDNYCDFLDIRIPPGKKCKIFVPSYANYNLYFSNTPENSDDEMIEIYTGDLKRISLYPGLTKSEEQNYNQIN